MALIRTAALLGSAFATGCFLFHGVDDDSTVDAGLVVDGRVPDGSTGDGSSMCGAFGIYPACGDFCEPGCFDTAPPSCARCEEGSACSDLLSACRPVDELGPGERRTCGTEFGVSTTFTNGCSSGEYACVVTPVEDFDPFDPLVPGRAGCVHASYCVDARGLFEGVHCYYTDRTPVITGPPEELCPDSPSDIFRFCGRGCEGCDISDEQPFPPSCLGVNDERGIGICTDRGCRPGEEILDPAFAIERYGEPTACLVPRHAETREYWEYGWAVGVETCRLYRSLYPEDFDCRDIDWASLPE